ncbi:pre-60S factor rei1 [Exophiala xenobiotica]|uniref:Pre-60S factor rei1 n=1 Tax=Vermiconidia calcicola TaxID=1690605 RepID=A0AAV9Q8I0_9PEZI|nr:pre-60S factor rei1 [Exophiala xenobiotica]KAK5536963.1 pre-60S factor rei1 [Chaetothyriales sp. CCFEE 6169]KAK5537644.1 pre-60S factor rei1 [Vermiconidia calcicola]KAK5190093.1 pre-60S factor rei1 [Exophiala xenobiotica]KAK5204202.1 pre-60S factor rei1 [Exophiala xenobiotica]
MAATAPEPAEISQTHPYTCNSCSVAFRNSDAQRTHMRSDWHRYNLKRRLAELPSVSSEDYNEKVLAAQASNNEAAAQAAFAKSCATCQKTYYSENAYQNHLTSKAHRLREMTGSGKASRGDRSSTTDTAVSKVESAGDSEPRDPEAEAEFEKVVAGMKDTSLQDIPAITRRPSAPPPDAEPREDHPMSPEKPVVSSIPLSRCLFCNYDSPNFKLSVLHMTKIHSLFIPEQNYLADPEGLVKYMQAKIHENFECLYCHRLRGNAEGVQTHMRDKGHCKIAFETEEEMIEVGQFYDFSSTYSDDGAGDSDMELDASKSGQNGGVKLTNGEQNGEDEGWETDSSFSSLDTEDLASVPIDDRTSSYQRLPLHRHHSNAEPRPHKHTDGFHSHAHNHNNAVFYDEFEMHLPSGRIAGHRNLRKYYRQNLHSYPTAAERMERAQRLIEEGSDADMEDVGDLPITPPRNSVMRRGEAGMVGTTNQQRRDVRSQEIRSRQKEQRTQNRYQAKLEKQNNFQKHFRDPLLQ